MSDVQRSLLVASLSTSDPSRCVKLTRNPSSHAFYALKTKLHDSSQTWIRQFLDQGGLDSLLDCLEQLSGREFTTFSDAVLQLDCLECVRVLLNTKTALSLVAEDQGLVRKLVMSIDTPNTLAKKHMFELLTALCVYSPAAHDNILSALTHYQKVADVTSPCSLVMNELKLSDTPTYKRTLVAFINALICGHKDPLQRNRLRSELIGMELLDVLHHIRMEENDSDLHLQLEVFYEEKHKDEMELEHQHKFDYNSMSDLFYALMNKMYLQPEIRVHFTHILQDLYRMQMSANDQLSVWTLMSGIIHQITNRGSKPDAQKYIDTLSECIRESEPHKYENAKDQLKDEIQEKQYSLSGDNTSSSVVNRDSGISVSSNGSFYDNVGQPFRRQGSGRESFGRSTMASLKEEGGMLDIMKPKQPTKLVHWAKVTAEQANRPLSIWKQIQEDIPHRRSILNHSALENDFAETESPTKHPGEVSLLDASHSLLLNTFLARLEAQPEALAACLLEGDIEDIGQAGLQMLVNLLPSENEVAQLRNYTGSRSDLAPAEQFLLALSDHSYYRSLLDGLALKTKLDSRLPKLQSALHRMTKSVRDIIHHPSIRDFFAVLIEAGNFLNANSYIGQAAGIKFDTLRRLSEVKDKGNRHSLLYHVVKQVRNTDRITLSFLKAFPDLHEASRSNINDIKTEITQLNTETKKFMASLHTASQTVRHLLQAPFNGLKQNLQGLHDNVNHLYSLSSQMAQYFCEDPASFDLQKCLKEVNDFFNLIKSCDRQISLDESQKVSAADRRLLLEGKLKENNAALAFGNKAAACSSFCTTQTEAAVDGLLKDVHLGKFPCPDPSTGSDAPESANSSLMLSHIEASTPCHGHEDTPLSFCVNDVRMTAGRQTYVDKIERVTAERYHRDQQMTTASYLNPELLAKKTEQGEKDQQLQINFYPKIASEVPADLKVKPQHLKGHRRTNSDLDRSRRVEDKWREYRNVLQSSAGQVVPRAESEDILLSLGLATDETILEGQDEGDLEATLVVEDKAKPKKRTSIGFFKRFTSLRATLTLKNNDSNNKDKKAKKTKKTKYQGKENVPKH